MGRMSDQDHLVLMRRLGVPDWLVRPAEAGASGSSPSARPDGELPGVRATMAEMMANGEDPATVREIACDYDRSVRSGREPYPERRD